LCDDSEIAAGNQRGMITNTKVNNNLNYRLE